jgi:hypothetical protein
MDLYPHDVLLRHKNNFNSAEKITFFVARRKEKQRCTVEINVVTWFMTPCTLVQRNLFFFFVRRRGDRQNVFLLHAGTEYSHYMSA